VRVQGLGFEGSRFRVSGFRVLGLGFLVFEAVLINYIGVRVVDYVCFCCVWFRVSN
jgi:hypothetical protein